MVECVEVIWTHAENRGGQVYEETNRILCEKCEVERKFMNVMEGWYEKKC